MRLPSIDLGNRRNRDYNLSTVSTSESTRSLASVLRHWQHPPAGGGSVTPLGAAPAAPPGTEAMRGNTLPTRSASSRSLASKISRAFVARKQNASIDISAPISSSVLHPGLAVSDFGTPTRNSEGWDEFVRVVNIGRDSPVDERKYSVDRLCSAPSLPDIPNMSPMMPLSSTPGRRSMDHSSLGSPFFLPPTPIGIPSMSSRSNYSPPQRVPSKRTSHTRHNSLPTSVLMGSRYQHPYSPPSPQDTPTRPRNANRRGAFYERPPQHVLFDGTDPSPGRASPAMSSSMRSTTSSQFKIRRKPVPSLEIDTTETGLGYPSSTSGGCSSRSVSGGSGDRSLFSSPSQSLSTCSPVEEVPPSIAYVVPLPTPRKDESFKQEIDMLFDELMEQCRTASPQSTPTRNKHQRSVSLLDPPRDGGANLRRTHATTRKSVSKLSTSFSLPSIMQVDDEKDLSDSEHQECHEKENTEPPTPRPKHHRVNDLRPFFPSGRSFEPIRAIAGKSSTPVAASATSPVLPATPRPGYVKNAVRQLEHHPSSPVVTPVTKLGALLQQKARVDSDELTLESKRIMEEARRRRANTLK